jgi:alkylation response protein AidB-like acyl-CoA dehydrogenase
MNFGDTPEEAEFRAEARAWLHANAPGRTPESRESTTEWPVSLSVAELDERERAQIAQARDWQHKLYDAGWAGISWPKEYGGRGATPIEASIFAEELAAFDPPVGWSAVSVGMVGPTLIVHGSEEQKRRHLGPILRGDEVWCQLFSEPGAGSDLAGLRSRADRAGDGWVVNGQKVWTTGARVSQFGALLARTDGSRPKHGGLTYFIVDMSAPGIEIRPLRQLNGDAHFNEVYFTDVRLPPDAAVGQVNDGWRVANTMLLNERGMIGGRQASDLELVVELARVTKRTGDPLVRQEIARVYAREQILRLLDCEARTALSKGTTVPAIASITKLLAGWHGRDLTRFALELLGPEGMLIDSHGYCAGGWQQRFLSAPVGRIAGGSDEIQKNILGERFLGLPSDYRPDRNVPFDDIPKA